MASRGKALIFMAAGLGGALGCGARTDMMFDDGSGGVSFAASDAGGQAHGGTSAGSQGHGGTGKGGFGVGGSATAGGFNVGGYGVAGGYTAGNFGVAGGLAFGGVGGFPFGGSFGTAGFGAVGGIGEAGTGGVVELCVGAAPGACGQCVCQSCGPALNTCVADFGCLVIAACAQQTGCQGFSCYQAGTCRGVIDQFGGLTGWAVNALFAVVSCSVTSRAMCGCN